MLIIALFNFTHVEPHIFTVRRSLSLRRVIGDEFEGACEHQEILALLVVNGQISAKAAAIFYGKRTISGECDDLLAFFKGIGEQRRVQVVMVEIRTIYNVYTEAQMPYSSILSMASNLSNLHSIAIDLTGYADVHDVWACLVKKGICRIAERVRLTCHALCNWNYVEEMNSKRWTGAKDQIDWKEVKVERT